MTPTLAALQALAADTVVTVAARGGLQMAADVATVLLASIVALFFVVLLFVLLKLRRLESTLKRLGDRALRKADPLVERGKGVADNVEFISAAVRHDVERLSRTVASLTERLEQASDHMEERIDDFNALMDVVQGEAEEIFLGTAATARGVREGVKTLKSDDGGRDAPADGAGAYDEDDVFLTGAEGEAPAADGPAAPSAPAGERVEEPARAAEEPAHTGEPS